MRCKSTRVTARVKGETSGRLRTNVGGTDDESKSGADEDSTESELLSLDGSERVFREGSAVVDCEHR